MKKVRLISAISISSSGGKQYLELMKSNYDKKNTIIILDVSLKKIGEIFNKANLIYLKNNPFGIIKFLFIRIRLNIKTGIKLEELYLNARPPLLRFKKKGNINIFVQNRLIIDKNCDYLFNKRYRFKLKIQRFLFFNFLKKTDTVIFQTSTMKNFFLKEYQQINNVLVDKNCWRKNDNKEFLKYKLTNLEKSQILKIKKIANTNVIYFYPASALAHKNHINLINAFEKISDKNIFLILTINKNELNIKNCEINKSILFLGPISFRLVNEIYGITDFLIYPSLMESLGLPLLEAKKKSIKIISSNLPYVKEICNPDYVFNALSEKSIRDKIIESIFIK